MANPFNRLFQMALESGSKNGGNGNGLKIRGTPEYSEAVDMLNNANFQRNAEGELILDTADKTQMYQNITALSESISNEKNLFYEDVPFLQDSRRIRNVNKFGQSGYGKNKVAWKNLTNPNKVQFNTKSIYDETLKEMKLNRDYAITKRKNINAVNQALEEFGREPNGRDFIEFQQHNIRTVEAKMRLAKQLGLTLGHGKSAAHGGPMTGRNLWPQDSGSNFSRQHKGDLPDELLDILGVDTSWKIAVGKFLGEIPLTEGERTLNVNDMMKIFSGTLDWESVLQARRSSQ